MNKYAEAAMIQFDVKDENFIIKNMICELIDSKEKLNALREGLAGRRNKIHKVLCQMRRANSVKYAVGYVRSTGVYVYGVLEAVNDYLSVHKSREQSIVNAPLTWIYDSIEAMERKIQATINTCNGIGGQEIIPVQIVAV